MLQMCWNFTDANPTFNKALCENGIVAMMVSLLKEFQDEDYLRKEVGRRSASFIIRYR